MPSFIWFKNFLLKPLIVGLHGETKLNGGAFKLGHVLSGEEGKKCIVKVQQ
jgi:hypothetical protein